MIKYFPLYFNLKKDMITFTCKFNQAKILIKFNNINIRKH